MRCSLVASSLSWFVMGTFLPAAAQAAEVPGVKAVIELSQPFYYAGDPFVIKVSIGNDGEKPVANPVKTPLYEGFEVKAADGTALKARGKPDATEPERPEKLAPKTFYGSIVDLTQVFPELVKPGRFEVRWSAGGVTSSTILVQMLPRYDPKKEYRARLETDEGTLVIDFFRDSAPIATKAFIDLANSGFFDGLIFHEVRPEWFIATGDPIGDGTGSAPFRYPAELTSAVPVVAGTVVLRPVSAAPPANGSQFMIMLKPQPEMKGQLTVVGQVVEGLDVAQKVSRLPSTQQASRPYFKPLKDVRIRRVVISEKGTAAAGTN